MEVRVGLAAARCHGGTRSTARSLRLWVLLGYLDAGTRYTARLRVFVGRLDTWVFNHGDARLDVQKIAPMSLGAASMLLLGSVCAWILASILSSQTIECFVAPRSLRY